VCGNDLLYPTLQCYCDRHTRSVRHVITASRDHCAVKSVVDRLLWSCVRQLQIVRPTFDLSSGQSGPSSGQSCSSIHFYFIHYVSTFIRQICNHCRVQ